jgi:hypothetical protein
MANPIRIWKNRGLIMEGIKNNMFKTAHVENIAFYRNEICKPCEFIDLKGDSCAVPTTQPCCSECGCSLKLKTRSLASECPKGFWKAELTEEEEQALLKQMKK